MPRPTLTFVALLAAPLIAIAPWTTALRSQTPAARDPAAPSPPLVETSSLGGIVVLDGATPAPIRRATVTVTSREPAITRTAVTDDAGRFRVAPLPAGRFTMTVAKAGYVPTRSLTTPAATVAIADGQHASDVTLRLARGATITGRVIDQHGMPVASAGIVIAERRQVGHQTTARPVRMLGRPLGVRTDDRGIYRAFGLPAGSYVVAVTPSVAIGATLPTAAELQWARQGRVAAAGPSPPAGGAVTYAAVYVPGTADLAEAAAITVAAGEERTGVDIALTLVPTSEVSGRITWEDGEPVQGAQLLVAPQHRPIPSSGLAGLNRPAPSTADGRFTVTGLVPGVYTIMARAARPAAAGAAARGRGVPAQLPTPGGRGAAAAPAAAFWALAELRADGQRIDDLALVLKPGLTLSGRLAFEAAAGKPPSAEDLGRALVGLASAPDQPITLRVFARGAQPDGTFTLNGLIPGAYVLTGSLPAPAGAGWIVKSATAGGRDVLDAPLEVRPDVETTDLVVTLTDRISELSGQVTDSLGRPVPDFYVMAFSSDPATWREGSRWLAAPRRPGPDGRYMLTRLPPGEYYVAVVPEFEQAIWQTPEYLEQVVPGAIKVSIGEGEKKTQDITLGM